MSVRLGIIGMGYCGRQQLKAAATVKGLEVVAVADTSPLRGLELPPAVKVYEDWRQLLEDSRVEAVSLCLPHHLHAEMAIQALHAGKHLLLEKPLAAELAEAQRIAAAASASARVTMVEMTHRFYPPLQAGRALVLSGRLGEIYAVEDKVIERLVPERCPAWMFERKRAGGGVALTDGIHLFDRIAWVCGQPLRYHHGLAGYGQKLGDVEDTALLQLSLAGGAPVSVLMSFQRAGGSFLDDELTVYGTNGTLRIWTFRGWRFESQDSKAEEYESYPPDLDLYARIRVGMSGALTEFTRAIAEGRKASPDPGDILPAQEIVARFYAQVRAGDAS